MCPVWWCNKPRPSQVACLSLSVRSPMGSRSTWRRATWTSCCTGPPWVWLWGGHSTAWWLSTSPPSPATSDAAELLCSDWTRDVQRDGWTRRRSGTVGGFWRGFQGQSVNRVLQKTNPLYIKYYLVWRINNKVYFVVKESVCLSGFYWCFNKVTK